MAKKKKSNKTLYILLISLVGVIIILMVGNSLGWFGGPRKIEVEYAKAKTTTITEKVGASGTIMPVVEVKLSPDVAGEITELNVEEGDSVIMGQLLVKIRPDNFLSALDQTMATLNQQKANYESSKAALSRSEANFKQAEQAYNRQEKLFEEKVISEADWQIVEQNYMVAQNDLQAAKQSVRAAEFVVKSSEASVNQARENVRLTNVFAPSNGIVSKLSVEKGERVVGTQQMAGTEMLRIADLNNMEVRVNVNENDIIRLSLGDTAIIDVDAYSSQNKKFKGVVTAVANTANEKASPDAITEFEVRIRLLNDSYKDLITPGKPYPFRPGMTASVDVITRTETDILAVPLSAVTVRNPDKPNTFTPDSKAPQESATPASSEDDKEVVFVYRDGKVALQVVKTGISDFENIQILEGLKEGDWVISGPFLAVSKRLKDGDDVEVTNIEKEKSEKNAEKPDESAEKSSEGTDSK